MLLAHQSPVAVPGMLIVYVVNYKVSEAWYLELQVLTDILLSLISAVQCSAVQCSTNDVSLVHDMTQACSVCFMQRSNARIEAISIQVSLMQR